MSKYGRDPRAVKADPWADPELGKFYRKQRQDRRPARHVTGVYGYGRKPRPGHTTRFFYGVQPYKGMSQFDPVTGQQYYEDVPWVNDDPTLVPEPVVVPDPIPGEAPDLSGPPTTDVPYFYELSPLVRVPRRFMDPYATESVAWWEYMAWYNTTKPGTRRVSQAEFNKARRQYKTYQWAKDWEYGHGDPFYYSIHRERSDF